MNKKEELLIVQLSRSQWCNKGHKIWLSVHPRNLGSDKMSYLILALKSKAYPNWVLLDIRHPCILRSIDSCQNSVSADQY